MSLALEHKASLFQSESDSQMCLLRMLAVFLIIFSKSRKTQFQPKAVYVSRSTKSVNKEHVNKGFVYIFW